VDPKPGDRVSGTVSGATSQLPGQDSPNEPATSGEPTEESTSGTTDTQSTAQTAGGTKATEDSPGHETPQPGPPDHARGAIAEVSLAGNDLVAVGQTNAQINDDGTSQGDVTVLSLGGQEIIGAHSDSEGEESASVDPFAPLCEGSGGAVCLGLLFADTNSTNTPPASHSDASAAVAAVCLGGTNPDPGVTCDGQVSASAARSTSSIDRDKTTGAETATQETDLADACIGGEDEEGVCQGVGATAVHSESTSSVDGNKQAQTESSSYLANVQIGGTEAVIISDPTAITIPPNCPTPSLVCLFLNQGTESVSTGVAGSRQEAIHLSVLQGAVGGNDLTLAHAGNAETFVRWSTPTCCAPPPDVPRRPPAGPGLADTGFDTRVPLALMTLLALTGAMALAFERRRIAVPTR
jgi:hypothetical protein